MFFLFLLAGCPAPECADGWKPVLGTLDRSVLSIAGRGTDVFLVGGGLGVGGALVLRWNGTDTVEVPTGRDETLWWVWPGDDVWAVGEGGLVLRGDGTSFAPVASGTQATLFGVWGASADDVWIVGGNPGQGAAEENDVVRRWNGQTLSPAGPPARGRAFFKVWGAGSDVWIAGEGGTMWRWTGTGWEDHQLPTSASVLTVHGCGPDDVWAVAGQEVWRWQGAAWAKDRDTLAVANGVSCAAAGVLVVGNGGLKLRRVSGVWHDDTGAEPFATDFHGAWVAPGGQMWAGGGNFNAPPPVDRRGVVGVFGCPAP